jgi:hypothetical protein
MTYICDNCEKYPCTEDKTKLMTLCPAFSEKPKPMTNADRIRSMTDDELTRFFAENCGCGDWCMHHRSGACASKPENECCLDVWHKWLKEEAKNG